MKALSSFIRIFTKHHKTKLFIKAFSSPLKPFRQKIRLKIVVKIVSSFSQTLPSRLHAPKF